MKLVLHGLGVGKLLKRYMISGGMAAWEESTGPTKYGLRAHGADATQGVDGLAPVHAGRIGEEDSKATADALEVKAIDVV